jgi:pilus assembly protein Flp/PilA
VSATKPRKVNWRRWRERGQGLVEYAMILAMVAIVIIAILTYLGTVVQVSLYSKIGSGMEAIVH